MAFPKKLYSIVLAAIIFSAFVWIYSPTQSLVPGFASYSSISPAASAIQPAAKYFIDYPLQGPDYSAVFGELGQRLQSLTRWTALSDSVPKDILLRESLENLTLSMFPFLQNPAKPNNSTPVASLRHSYKRGSRGIVIALGGKDFRYAYHLVLNVRTVLRSKLPIQVVYAGNDDLPESMREKLLALDKNISFLNILEVLDNESMGLEKDWAIKAFAALASTFEQIILLDADCVFFKKPEVLFEQIGYKETGALFFHDRLLWQHGFQERHKWWKEQMEHQEPSETLLKSKVWMEDYAEEADSGVVVLDKRRLPVFMGLLHVGWQNTKVVREKVTYKMTYGDKESWWFGLELCGVPYSFEKHYGAVLGELRVDDDKLKVCGFTIAHVDEDDHLLWENGSLLKNKAVNKTEFLTPSHWMIDASWDKGATKADMSCMKKGVAREVSQILQRLFAFT
jgi:alpha 1,3-mannosyltransferase